jgi:S1-C subfamily serine protease
VPRLPSFEQVSPSVLQVVGRQSNGNMLGEDAEGTGVWFGTRFIWNEAGDIVTNNHIVAGTSELVVRLSSGAVMEADVVGTAPNYDIGVIRLRNPGQLPRQSQSGVRRTLRSVNSPTRWAILTVSISR